MHDHLSLGFRRGCVACAQTEADLAISKRASVKADLTAVGEALWERVMDGDATAVPQYMKWLEREQTLHGINQHSEGGAGLSLSTPG